MFELPRVLVPVLLAGFAAAQGRADRVEPISESRLGVLQDFLSGEMGEVGEGLACIDPALCVIGDMDPKNELHREALAGLAAGLEGKKHFRRVLRDPQQQQAAALDILAANRDPANLAYVKAMLNSRLEAFDSMNHKKQERAAVDLAPVLLYGKALDPLVMKATLKRAKAIAELWGLQEQMGFSADPASGGSRKKYPKNELMPIKKIRMGQPYVGKFEVKMKAIELALMNNSERRRHLSDDPLPVFADKRGKLHVVKLPAFFTNDRHHRLAAAYQAGVRMIPVAKLPLKPDEKGQIYLRDERGRRIPTKALPADVTKLRNFEFRSIAWILRKLRAFDKSTKPFADMEWAHFFRKRLGPLTEENFIELAKEALILTRDRAARKLPGYLGKK